MARLDHVTADVTARTSKIPNVYKDCHGVTGPDPQEGVPPAVAAPSGPGCTGSPGKLSLSL
ncbi:hypothetical protein SBV1_300028 [Verrucomicrobia bacterium]|nr:hypothetical protein SBV1_300028 [Verrucomicrobiota bacterium]